MKIKVYGYYNYDNSYDKKEHLTLTPLSDIENRRPDRDYSGNVYEFETNERVKVWEKSFKDLDGTEIKEDFSAIGDLQIGIINKYGVAYIVDDDKRATEPFEVMLGKLKYHKIQN